MIADDSIISYHILSEKCKTFQCAHSLCRGINVAKNDVCLAAHLRSLKCYYIENDAVGGK